MIEYEGRLRETDSPVDPPFTEPGIEKFLDAAIDRAAVFRQQAPLPGIFFQQALGNCEVAVVAAQPAYRLAERCQLQVDVLQVQ